MHVKRDTRYAVLRFYVAESFLLVDAIVAVKVVLQVLYYFRNKLRKTAKSQ